MRSIVTVTAPNAARMLTTLDHVKDELHISATASDTILTRKILEASDDIEAALGFMVRQETVQQTFWPEATDLAQEYLVLDRTPVASVESVVVDGQMVDTSTWRIDPATGMLYALCMLRPAHWYLCESIAVTYTGGYLLPGQQDSDLPAGIEGACIELVSDYWLAKGRDPSVRSEEIPGVRSVQYWVGAVGDAGELPPRVTMKLERYRRALV